MLDREAEKALIVIIYLFIYCELEFFYEAVRIIYLVFLFSQILLRVLDNKHVLCWNYILEIK